MKATFDKDDRNKTPKPPSSPPALPHPHDSGRGSTAPLALPDVSAVVNDLQPPTPSPIGRFQNTPEVFREPYHPIYMSGNAARNRPPNMSESRSSTSSSEQGRSGSRGRSHSQSTNPARRPPLRQPFQASLGPPLYPSGTLESSPASSAPSPSFQGLPAPYQAASLSYGQRAGFVGQYTMSPHSPVNMPPTYAYPHHPGLHAPDTSMHPPQNQLLGYSPNTLVPIMQPHTPVFQGYPGASPEGSSSSSHSRSFTTSPGPSSLFSPHSHPHAAHSPAHPSPPPHTPLASQGGSGLPPHSTSYPGQTPYAPLRYPTPPFAYPPHSFAPSPSVYASQYANPYPPHSYAPEPPQEGQGTWWYLPLPARPASSQYESYQNPYSVSFNLPPREVEAYSQAGPSALSSPMYPMSPRQNPIQYPPPQQQQLQQQAQMQPDPPPPPLPAPSRAQSEGPASSSRQYQKQPEAGSSAPPSSRSAAPERSRRPHHPHPPAQRSEWVMWVGNVPSDTTHDELWRFLNQTPSPGAASASSSTSTAHSADDVWGGVLSIFLISRSNCAFVNFQSEAHLLAAIRHFNGQPLRPGDPRCPRLVCRVRGRDDDVKAGVGGQRGAGLHVRWIRDQKEKAREAARAAGQEELRSPVSSEHVTTPGSSPSDPVPYLASLNLSSDDEGGRGHRYRRPDPHSSSSGSYASTNSSILMQYFPKRYFILKSLTQKDLDISVEKGLWATQRHNETTLDQAFRTSKEVYLIFGVNKSGEFYGYARMAGPIMRGEHRVAWTSRTDSPPQRRMSRSSQGSSPPVARRDTHTFFSPSEFRYEESPQPVSPSPPASSGSQAHQQMQASPQPYDEGATPRSTLEHPRQEHPRHPASAPMELHEPHRRLSRLPGGARHTQTVQDAPTVRALGQIHMTPSLPTTFNLDPDEPFRHIRERSAPEPTSGRDAPDDAGRRFDWETMPETPLDPVAEEEERPGGSRAPSREHGARGGSGEAEGPAWGEPFKVQWIQTNRLPFYRTRHLRNPWNHDREIKVSRDGTELEPSVGQALLEEWDRPAPPSPVSPSTERRPGTKTSSGEGDAGPSTQPPLEEEG